MVSGQHTISSSGVSCLGMAAAGSFLGIGSQSGVHSLGSVGGGRVDEMCEGDVDESSVT